MNIGTRHWNLTYALFALGLLLLFQSWWAGASRTEVVSYSALEQALADGRVERVVVTERWMRAYLKSADPQGKSVLVAERVEPDTAARLERFKVPFEREHDSTLLPTLLSWILPTALMLAVWYFFFRPMTGQAGSASFLSIGKSQAKVLMEKSTGVTFDDVAGVDEAKEELREIVDFLKDPRRYGRLGARIPKGVLLVGPPGTGKTLLARALAGEAGVTFLSTNGAEFVEMFVGVGAARVRDLFEQARRSAPAIIFIDELDALGRARGAWSLGGHDEKEQTLNQLLAEMDGFDPSVGVIILGATNRPEILDPALLRAGRFDRQVLVDRPDLKGRLDVLRVHARKVKLAADADLEAIAAMTAGFAGADLANVVNEAALLATRRGADAVSGADLLAAIERIVAGLEKKSRLLNPVERRTVACHELGHALVAMSLPGTDPVQKVSIIPRGVGALGYTIQRPTGDRFLLSRDELRDRLTVLLAGRAAEMLLLGVPSTGAADDLAKATELARACIMRYGMDEELGLVAWESERRAPLLAPPGEPGATGLEAWAQPRNYSEATAQRIDAAVQAQVRQAFERATAQLVRHRATLEQAVRDLLARETLAGAELESLRKSLQPAQHASGG
ncbi:MAG: ATP-dependent zinc metalloprotease FtsH [Steroidobacteraceae bacterium]